MTIEDLETMIESLGPAGSGELTAATRILTLEGDDVELFLSEDGTLRVVTES